MILHVIQRNVTWFDSWDEGNFWTSTYNRKSSIIIKKTSTMDFYWDRPVLRIDSIRKTSTRMYNRISTYNSNLRVGSFLSIYYKERGSFSPKGNWGNNQTRVILLKWSKEIISRILRPNKRRNTKHFWDGLKLKV